MITPTVEELRKVFLEGLIESAKDLTSREDPQDAGYRALFECSRRSYSRSDPTGYRGEPTHHGRPRQAGGEMPSYHFKSCENS